MKVSLNSNHLIELVALIAILVATLFLRWWQLAEVPLGLHFDEAIDLRQGLLILDGARPIYITEGWGREALFYYPVAFMLKLIPFNPLALRAAAVVCGLIGTIIAYWLARQMFNPIVAWFTVAWMGVTFWAQLTHRFGVRGMALLLLVSLTMATFWWAWRVAPTDKWGLARYAVAGTCLGLTFYTYQPARFFGFVFFLFGVYVLLFHKHVWQQRWRGLLVMAVTAVFLVMPLVYTVSQSEEEAAGRGWTIEPLTELLDGNPRPIMENSWATANMFTVRGDPLLAYNLPQRPVFQPGWTGFFFYAGLLIALWRWRDPRYALLLIWMGVMLLPTVVTIDPPNFNRTLGAQPAIMMLAALPIGQAAIWLQKQKKGWLTAVPIGVALIALLVTAQATWQDYFGPWAAQELLAVQYNNNLGAIIQHVYHTPELATTPLLISSRNIEDVDPYIFSVSLDDAPDTRWIDTSQALVLPAAQPEARLFVAADRWLDHSLVELAALPPPLLSNDHFSLFTLSALPQPPADQSVVPLPADRLWTADLELDLPSQPLPLTFAAYLQLAGYQMPAETAVSGTPTILLTNWQVKQDGQPMPMAFFVHLINEQGEIIAQQDGLGFPPHSWATGDQFWHVHQLWLPADLPTGTYWFQLGLYNRTTSERWLLSDGLLSSATPSDRLLIGPLMVE